ncbi:MAG: type III-A CRISPR-associated RAMP protein Csm5 [Clostridia bacterium]|nr:type III-A CRISPR-associated RAMP protein Csm5 [Clostridia bacterium]
MAENSVSKNLETFHIKLTALSPVHVGSGNMIEKQDIYFYPERNEVTVFNMERLFSILADRRLADDYERYVLGGKHKSLREFFYSCRLSPDDVKPAVLYTVSSKGVFDREPLLTAIHQFVRLPDCRPYIPGSALKGALRTVLLNHLIKEGSYSRDEITKQGRYGISAFTADKIENALLNKLNYKDADRGSGSIKSVMRGISVSDSEPIENGNIILAQKFDSTGKVTNNKLNLVRECVRPGTTFRFSVSVDKSVYLEAGIEFDSASLQKYIRENFEYYQNTFLSHFDNGYSTLPENSHNCIYLGGGAGFFSKTFVYKALGFEKGLSFVSEYLTAVFKGKNEKDLIYGISPHMLKCTRYNGKLVQFGLCKVEME